MTKTAETPVDKATVLDTIWVNHDVRYWQSHIRVVHREVHHDDGVKSYVNIELQVGSRWLAMPLWLVDDTIKALILAKAEANDYAKSLSATVTPPVR